MESGSERRGLLRLFAFVFGGLCGGAGLATVLDPLRGGEKRWIPLAALDTLKTDRATRIRYTVTAGWEQTERSVYLTKDRDGDGSGVRAIDARCTHLGCNVRFRRAQSGQGEFRCPCHNGVFDAEGQPVSGPVTIPLERMETRIRNGVVEGKV